MDRFADALGTAYRRLIESGAVSISVAPGVVRVEPAVPGAPRLELRMTGSVGDLFLDDLDPFEVDSREDFEEFVAFVQALVDGELDVVFRRTLLGWRPAAVEWPGGLWSLPGVGFGSRRERVRAYG
ncbi:hypothetical protein DMH01_33160 [Amycolatopsis sp. WAC 04182]|uniref:hypothetical protein n=1 Tax=Amycolatopsis sp. WAC 04182 TaxID=2203198 RepID=UPI000F77F207|nr:hypothetical protein [Amycolatopsis sp. WAC 04182]RSN55172.1 hypothetical protein DMH01_33160 [Amycolatopsis sp. WAC 04182]